MVQNEKPEEYKVGLSTDEVKSLAKGKTITKLSSNENPFGPSPKAVKAAHEALENAHIYPPRNDVKLCESLAAFHGRGLQADQFFAANSGVEVLSMIEDALISPGERAIICPPSFGAYASSLGKKSVVIDRVALTTPDFLPDVQSILAAVTSETRLVYLCNPNNPTGTWFGEEVLDQILDNLPDHVSLIYDEVYFQFATENGLPDAIRHVLDGRNIVIVHSFSKAYGLAGLRVGYGIAPVHLIQKFQKGKRSFHISAPAMAGAQAALDDVEHLNATVDNNHAERPRIRNGLLNLGLEALPSQSNFVMFSCPKGMDAKTMTAALVAEGVMVRPAFDLPDHIRVTIGTPTDNDRLLAAVAKVLKEIS